MVVAALNGCAFTLAILLLALSPSADGRYAVYVAGAPRAAEIAAAAGGEIIAASASVAVVHSGDPGFRRRAAAAGATLVFNPLLALGCFDASAATSRSE